MRYTWSVILLVVSAPAALADWQYTHWGMTMSEVTEASPMPLNKTFLEDELVGDYEAGGFEFQVRFRFNAGKLWSVDLVPKQMFECTDLKDALLKNYGPARESGNKPGKSTFFETGDYMDWTKADKNLDIEWFYGTSDCVVRYKEVKKERGVTPGL